MNKFFLRLLTCMTVIGLLVGCGTGEQNNDPQENPNNATVAEQEEVVFITISVEGEEIIKEQEIKVESGAILLDVLKENFTLEEEGGMITSLEGQEQDADKQKYWLYTVNGEIAPVGAGEHELKKDDKVIFDLQILE